MKRIRVIPVLLIRNGGLVKSVRFKRHQYIGDPINAVRIFNEKEVDEIVLLDISATASKEPPDLKKIQEITSEAFMPLAWGGGISTLEEIKKLIGIGIEKIILNSRAFNNPALIEEAAKWAGSQSVVVSIDVKRNFWGKHSCYINNGTKDTALHPVTLAKQMESAGAGEILLQDIDREGTFEGYNLKLIEEVSSTISIPLVAASGAGSINDFTLAMKAGASAVAAGSYFVLQRPHRAVLISYPSQQQLTDELFSQIA